MNNNIQTPDPSAQLQMIQESFTNHTVLGFDKAEVKDQARSFHAFGDVKYVKADHYESGPLIYLRMANFVSNHQDKLNAAELKELTQVLDKQIEEIHADTSGIGGFFRYLFSPRAKAEKNNQKAYLESLKTIVDNILEAQQKKSVENEIDHHSDVALSKEVPIDSENSQAELKLAQPLDLAQSIAFFPMQPVAEPISQPFLRDLPQELLSQSLPPSFFQAKGKDSLPPPIPFAPRFGVKIQPKLFAGEPQQPLFLKIANDKMPLEKLQKEIKEIETYLKESEKSIAPIRSVLDEVAKKEERLKEIRQD